MFFLPILTAFITALFTNGVGGAIAFWFGPITLTLSITLSAAGLAAFLLK